jgi:transposase-like protein
MLKERVLEVDHSSIQRWVVEYSHLLAKKFTNHKKPVGKSWRMNETYINIKGAF